MGESNPVLSFAGIPQLNLGRADCGNGAVPYPSLFSDKVDFTVKELLASGNPVRTVDNLSFAHKTVVFGSGAYLTKIFLTS